MPSLPRGLLNLLAVTAMLLLCSACTGLAQRSVATQVPAFAPGMPAPDATLPDVDSFLAIDDEMKAFVQRHVVQGANRRERLRRLSRVMLDEAYLGIRYDAALTLGAAEVFRRSAANCLSFSALFVVLAREAGLDARFQEIPVLPNWRLEGDTFVVERHVNVRVRIDREDYVVDFRPPDAVTRAAVRRIDDGNATAQYFSNLGVAELAAGRLDRAYLLLRRALQSDPGAAAAWVNLGVVLGRNSQFEDAATAYRAALAREPRNLSALGNLAALERFRGNAQAADALDRRVDRYRRDNPYYLYWQGQQLLGVGQAEAALQAFARAARLLPREPDFHLAMAEALRVLGRSGESAASYAEALEHAGDDAARERLRQRYQRGDPRAAPPS
jgi:tetratricopeptide (TPR) repeat protein